MINGVNGSSQPYAGKTSTTRDIPNGKHQTLKENHEVRLTRGVTDIWVKENPETGEKKMWLEGDKGNLIREFDLNMQMEQVRHYFNKANERMLNQIKYERQLKETKAADREFDRLYAKVENHINLHTVGGRYEDRAHYYTVDDKKFHSKNAATRYAIEQYSPDDLQLFDKINEKVSDTYKRW